MEGEDPGWEVQPCDGMCDTSKTIPTPTLPLPLMVGKLNTSAIVSMEPRNVMLEKKKEKKVRDEKEAEVNHEREKNVAAELAGPSEPKPADEGLLRAIASFLGRRGFSKTLSALQSENRGVVIFSLFSLFYVIRGFFPVVAF